MKEGPIREGPISDGPISDGPISDGDQQPAPRPSQADAGPPRFRSVDVDAPKGGSRHYLTDEEWQERRRPEGVADIVDRVMTSIGGGRAAPGAQLAASWEEIVGRALAAKTRPGSCTEGRLVILVADGATASKMRFLTAQILQNAAGVVGEGVVGSISFRVTPGLGP